MNACDFVYQWGLSKKTADYIGEVLERCPFGVLGTTEPREYEIHADATKTEAEIIAAIHAHGLTYRQVWEAAQWL